MGALEWAALIIGAVIAVTGGAFVSVRFRAGRMVDRASRALTALADLNVRFGSLVIDHPTFRLSHIEQVRSKAAFDRQQLDEILMVLVQLHERAVSQAVEERRRSMLHYERYRAARDAAVRPLLGSSFSGQPDSDRLTRIEAARFERRSIKRPRSRAKVTIGVSYRSPKGRNHYSRSAKVSFELLAEALDLMAALREHWSSESEVRRRERARMTRAVRQAVFARDGKVCRHCSRTSAVVPMEIDHIVPIARGGLTEMTNLQVLCRPCNRRKGDTFIG